LDARFTSTPEGGKFFLRTTRDNQRFRIYPHPDIAELELRKGADAVVLVTENGDVRAKDLGMFTRDQAWRDFACHFVEECNGRFPISSETNGIMEKPGTRADFSQALTLPGHPMWPLGVPNGVPSSLRKTDKLDSFDDEFARYALRAMWADYRVKTLSINLISTSGLGTFSKLASVKGGLFAGFQDLWPWMLNFTPEQVIRAAPQFFMGYHVTRRLQTDAFIDGLPKSRKVFDIYGDEVEADKSLSFDERMARERVREAFAASGSWSYNLQSYVNGVRDSMLRIGEAIFHFEDMAEVALMMPDAKWCIIIDFKNFDKTHPRELLLLIAEELPLLNANARAFIKAHYTFPVLAQADYPGMVGHKWTCDPTKPMDVGDHDFGLPSGTPLVDVAVKAAGVFSLSPTLRSLPRLRVVPAKELADMVVKNRVPGLKLVVLGDNIGILGKDMDDYALLREYLSENKHPYYQVDYSPRGTIMGGVVVKDGRYITLIPSGVRYAEGLLWDERDIDNRMRQYWRWGESKRDEFYFKNPACLDIRSLFEKLWRLHFGHNYQRTVRGEPMPPPIAKHMRNAWDLLWLQDQGKVYGRGSIDELSEEFRDQLFLSIPPRDVELNLARVWM
jgi:hypothetical protein